MGLDLKISSSEFHHAKNEIKTSSAEKHFLSKSSNNGELDNRIKRTLNIWVEGIEIGHYDVNYYRIGKHLRGIMSEDEYWHIGLALYNSLTKKQWLEITNSKYDENESHSFNGKNCMDAICCELNVTLDSLPNHKGTTYRYLELYDEFIYSERVKIGDLIMDKSFLATSLIRRAGGKSRWYDQSTSTNTIFFLINGNSGKNISEYSNSSHEQEILFKPKTLFEVTRLESLGNNCFYVYLNETKTPQFERPIKNIINGTEY